MRKISLTDYTFETKVPDMMKPGSSIDAEFPYHVRDQMASLLFVRDLGLNGAELVKANMLAQKIIANEGDELLLEEAEWQRLKVAVDAFKGFGQSDVEFVNRILEAEEVEVEKK